LERSIYNVLVVTPEGDTWKTRHRWENNIKMNLEETE
jgi:hypothetical protein